MELEQEIEHHGDSGRARVVARDVNQRIIEDDEALPHFARANQNIAAEASDARGPSGPLRDSHVTQACGGAVG